MVVAAFCFAMVLFELFKRPSRNPTSSSLLHNPSKAVFLFEDSSLVDATSSGQEFVARMPRDMTEFEGLIQVLSPPFPTLADQIENLSDFGSAVVESVDNENLFVEISRSEDLVRITLNGVNQFNAIRDYQALEDEARNQEAETLRFVFDNTPQLIWREDEDGQVTWANNAYLKYSDFKKPQTELTGKAWPAHRLFDGIRFPITHSTKATKTRLSVQLDGQDAEHWFDIRSIPGPEGALHFADDANEIMRAEEAQKAFMATITNTFAQLSIGLAIFDRKRRLASYNPAFADVTKLPASFLIGRPSIEIVLDRLRDLQRLPEPKDYTTFRDQFAALEAEAQNGTYMENWEMPDGQTYRVTGRPHLGGALAFLFEDITAEVSLTRRFRSELETGQAVIDNITDAIAVFSPTNTLVMSNLAYTEIWTEHASLPDLRTSLREWKSGCVASGAWRNIETFAHTHTEREAWSENIFLKDGRQFELHALPLPGSMTMIKFSKTGKRNPTLQKLTATDQALLYSKT